MTIIRRNGRSGVPLSAGLLLGMGLGGFFDGIVLHQLLQWHHMISSWYPINIIDNLEQHAVGWGFSFGNLCSGSCRAIHSLEVEQA